MMLSVEQKNISDNFLNYFFELIERDSSLEIKSKEIILTDLSNIRRFQVRKNYPYKKFSFLYF